MAGAFKISKYETNDGNIVPIRIQPETEALAIGASSNDPPSSAASAGWPSAQVSKSRRSIGINARKVSVRFTGTVPTGYAADGTIAVPVLSTSFYDSIAKGATGTYLGADVIVIGKSPESIV